MKNRSSPNNRRTKVRRFLLLTRWVLREPANWRISLLIFLVILFSLTSGVAIAGELEFVLDFTASRVVSSVYPFLFPLISILVTLAIVIQREGGGLASLQALGLRRGEILASLSLSIVVLSLVPAFLAFLVLPPILEPRLITQGNLSALFPLRYWTSMPRLFLAILFLVLFSVAFALFFRRAALAFGAMITFFFVGWYLAGPLGIYSLLTPPVAFSVAYKLDFAPVEGIPFAVGDIFLIYLIASGVAFLAALFVATRWGELD